MVISDAFINKIFNCCFCGSKTYYNLVSKNTNYYTYLQICKNECKKNSFKKKFLQIKDYKSEYIYSYEIKNINTSNAFIFIIENKTMLNKKIYEVTELYSTYNNSKALLYTTNQYSYFCNFGKNFHFWNENNLKNYLNYKDYIVVKDINLINAFKNLEYSNLLDKKSILHLDKQILINSLL